MLRTSGLLILLLILPVSSRAQTQPLRPAASSLRTIAASSELSQSLPVFLADTVDSIPRRIRPTHWKKGALIGGLALGAGLAVLSAGVCSAGAEAETDCSGAPVAGALLGAVLGGVIGALIGGQFPKEEKSSDSGGVR